MNAVQNSVGFAAMDSMLLRTLETWFRDQQRSIAAAAASSTASTAEADAYYSLAMQHWHTGDAAQGEAAARKALAIRMRFYGPLHIATLVSHLLPKEFWVFYCVWAKNFKSAGKFVLKLWRAERKRSAPIIARQSLQAAIWRHACTKWELITRHMPYC